jgi:subtilisin family serine protease
MRSIPTTLITLATAVALTATSYGATFPRELERLPLDVTPVLEKVGTVDPTGRIVLETARPAIFVGEGSRDVLVELDAKTVQGRAEQKRKARRVAFDDAQVRAFKRGEFKKMQRAFARRLGGSAFRVVRKFRDVPAVVVHVEGDADLATLQGTKGVAAVHENLRFTPSLAQSLPQIGQPATAATGAIGAGTTVAVLDTGVDFTNVAFGPCTAAGPGCRVAVARDFAPEDNSRDDDGHGTNVAGIVAGVAPGARLLALDVFQQGANGPTTDVISLATAIDFVVGTKFQFNTVAINMSLGIDDVGSEAHCTTPFDVFFAEAQAVGIMPIVASGNDSDPEHVSIPGCSPLVVSVGRVNDDDTVAASSNSSRALDLLAPGTSITAGGQTLSGTSMACPHVAGAWAVMRAARPALDLGQVLQALKDTGVPVTDSRQGRTTPRIRLDAAIAASPGIVIPPAIRNFLDLAPIEAKLVTCQAVELGDGFRCGFETVKDVVTDAALCGVETVTSAAQCGLDTVTSAAKCGTDTVTSAAQCGFDFVSGLASDLLSDFDLDSCSCQGFPPSCTCQFPATCQVANTCDVPASCQVALTCTIERNCDPATEICDPARCEVRLCQP